MSRAACLQPNERYHLDIMREICARSMFVFQGRVSPAPDFTSLIAAQRVRSYLGDLIERVVGGRFNTVSRDSGNTPLYRR